MALLTEEQMHDLRETIQNNDGSILYCINKWNEKQPSTQFEPNWSRAPKSAVGASVSLTWVTETGYNTLGYTLANYDRPALVITPHPHAEIMAKYAEVAARRIDPWVEFEGRCEAKNWTKCCGFNGFHPDFEYRHIGE